MRLLRKFSGVIDEWTASISSRRGAVRHVSDQRAQLPARIALMPGQDLIHDMPVANISILKIRDDQIILRGKAPIETDLGDACLFDDRLDPDTPNTPAVKQFRRDLENLVARGFCRDHRTFRVSSSS